MRIRIRIGDQVAEFPFKNLSELLLWIELNAIVEEIQEIEPAEIIPDDSKPSQSASP